MSEISKGLANGLTNYGDPEFANYLRRSFAKSMGYTNESLDKPIVGICYTESSFNNCHRHFPEMLEAVKRGGAGLRRFADAISDDLPGGGVSKPNLNGLP